MDSDSEDFTSLFLLNIEEHENDDDEEDEIIQQFVEEVLDFSSQYGSEISVSYTAFNLRGPPSNFPDYGDYPQAFVMRTYGTWWDTAPSGQKNYMPQNTVGITSQDFVEVAFAKDVLPREVSVYETYNPGALVRIWARGPLEWMLLWEGEPEYAGDKPRIFSPEIRQLSVPVCILRLEFNHTLLPYYTELDAILLKGVEPPSFMNIKKNFVFPNIYETEPGPIVEKGKLMRKIIASNLHHSMATQVNPMRKAKKLKKMTMPCDFERLPDESILCVMKYLDVQSLCRCAQVNTHFNRLASDTILYRCLDLRPYWHCVTSHVLLAFSQRCKYLQKLDLSWCGSHCMVLSYFAANFLKDNGAELTHLRMNCCDFVDDSVLSAIVTTTHNLQELCLRSVTRCTDWMCLSSLKTLKRLDVYRTDITTAAAVNIIKSNHDLEHLNVGSCKMITTMDAVAIALGTYCPNLISVDFWKSYTLTPNGIRALGNCKLLQELDVGWCLQAGGSGEWLAWLSGTELRKLFLGALRGVSDRDLRALIPRTRKLVQLDLLGVRAVTPDICDTILTECRELKLLDISFCDQIQESQVVEWRELYPHVSIKRSYQSVNLTPHPYSLFLAPSLE